MTDERSNRIPGTRPDDTQSEADEARDVGADQPRPASDEEGNPLLREGPDAPDAADIEDPDEQL